MAFLIFLSGDLKGSKFEIDRDSLTIGRSHDNTIQMNDPSVSSHHCEFTRSESTYTLIDKESTNGSFVNGMQVVEPVEIHPKDIIQLGDMEMIFDAPELLQGDDYAERTTTTGIIVKPGNIARKTPANIDAGFAARKDNRTAWIAVTAGGVLAAVILFAWFMIKLFR